MALGIKINSCNRKKSKQQTILKLYKKCGGKAKGDNDLFCPGGNVTFQLGQKHKLNLNKQNWRIFQAEKEPASIRHKDINIFDILQ